EPQRNLDLDRLISLRDDRGESERQNANGEDEPESWTGRWMPDRPNDPTPPPKVFPKTDQTTDFESSGSFHGGVPMGYSSKSCDDAKTNLTVDWDGNPISYTCYDERITPNRSTIALKYCERIPRHYVHGAIVALYHPCANPMEVKRLKNLLSSCLRRHVISPYNLLDERRPLVLVAWGCRLSMSYVNAELVVGFVREHALRGPEETPRDGDFSQALLHPAEIVSDLDDTMLCPSARTVLRD
ncbi:unnamed protein product, partial [Heterotrigona itama]